MRAAFGSRVETAQTKPSQQIHKRNSSTNGTWSATIATDSDTSKPTVGQRGGTKKVKVHPDKTIKTIVAATTTTIMVETGKIETPIGATIMTMQTLPVLILKHGLPLKKSMKIQLKTLLMTMPTVLVTLPIRLK